MKKKLTYIIFFLIFLSVILIAYYTNNKIIRPNQHALLLKGTEKYANNLNYYYPFITGLISELVDHEKGTLPLTANERFDQFNLLEQIQIMERLTNNAIDEKGNEGIFTFKRHIYEKVIIQTSLGQYSFLKSSHTLTLPSGICFDKTNYNTLLEINNKKVMVNDAQLSVKAAWGIPIQSEKIEEKITNTYSNEAVVTFIDDKVVSIYLKGVDTLAGEFRFK
ncbi:hypothetical protein [Paenibacillus mesotrionivorans]|uniref:Uncharacterized protein n=1 Tax=Paenibacillus mesotrionivorans TaxID=3160968 RepID=A0ACC7NU47_9BACL